MARGEDLFARIEAGGIASINELIADRTAEELFLDFKRSPDNGAGRTLADEDSKNLSRAISGFGNSEGGVIIWGVDCRRGPNGVEVATLAPLDDAHGFRTKLESAISRLTTPPHARVTNTVALLEGSRGCVATLIPQAGLGPIRALASGTDRYYLRAGDSFVSVPHEALAGLFGRKPRADLWPQLLAYPMRQQTPPSPAMTMSIGLGVYNPGPLLAERPYVSIHHLCRPMRPMTVQAADPARAEAHVSPISSWQVVAKEGVVIAPGWFQSLCTLSWTLNEPGRGDVHLQLNIGAQNVAPRQIEIECDGQRIADAYSAAIRGTPLTTNDIFDLQSIVRQFQIGQ